MAEQAERVNIFVYTGEQEVPDDITHVIIDRSVKIVPLMAFKRRRYLVSVETHDGIEKIGGSAFYKCTSLREIKLPGVKEIGNAAFWGCRSLTDVEFGDELETIGQFAFAHCKNLRRIAIPLKDNMFAPNQYQQCTQFCNCSNLTVDLVGLERIHKTIASLLLESWKDEMNQEIDCINRVLTKTPANAKTAVIRLWIESVINRMEHYKSEHSTLLKEDMTQLELAVWKAKLDEVVMDHSLEAQPAKKAKIDTESVRIERRIVSGVDIIIKNVLPFLQLSE
jgi:hypothetical protein